MSGSRERHNSRKLIHPRESPTLKENYPEETYSTARSLEVKSRYVESKLFLSLFITSQLDSAFLEPQSHLHPRYQQFFYIHEYCKPSWPRVDVNTEGNSFKRINSFQHLNSSRYSRGKRLTPLCQVYSCRRILNQRQKHIRGF